MKGKKCTYEREKVDIQYRYVMLVLDQLTRFLQNYPIVVHGGDSLNGIGFGMPPDSKLKTKDTKNG